MADANSVLIGGVGNGIGVNAYPPGETPKLPITNCEELFFRKVWRPNLYAERTWGQIGVTAIVHLIMGAGLILLIYRLFCGAVTDQEKRTEEEAQRKPAPAAPAAEAVETFPTHNGLPELPILIGDLPEMSDLQKLTPEQHLRLKGWYDSVKQLNTAFTAIMKSQNKRWKTWVAASEDLTKQAAAIGKDFAQTNIAVRPAAMFTEKEHADAKRKLKNLESCLETSNDKVPLTEQARNALHTTIAYQQALVSQIEAQYYFWEGYKFDA